MEKKLTRESLMISEGRITVLLRQLEVTVDQVLGGVVARGEGNEQALLDVEGELELRRTLQETSRLSNNSKYVGEPVGTEEIETSVKEMAGARLSHTTHAIASGHTCTSAVYELSSPVMP